MVKSNVIVQPEDESAAWHGLTDAQVLQHLQTDIAGLTEEEVTERRARFGANELPAPTPPTLLAVFAHQFLSPLIYILVAAGVVSLVIGEHTDAAFIFAVILLNAAIGTYQEWKAEKSAAALQSLLKIYARARREGQEQEVTAEELVPGDIVLMESGNRVPADLRLLKVRNFAVDESFLTGESMAVTKQTEPIEADSPVSDRSNMAFAGSLVESGRSVGVVVATGRRTEVGQIAVTVTEAKATKPPLIIRMEKFARQISVIILTASMLLGLMAFLQGLSAAEVFFMVVALAVSAIPEGLPVALTVALSVATARMARRQVIVRKLAAVESLGSCTCIASDKTGTLTVNKQTVKRLFLPYCGYFTVSGEGYSIEGEVLPEGGDRLDSTTLSLPRELARAAVLCNEAAVSRRGDTRHFHGDAVDIALLTFAHKLDLEPESIRREVTISGEIPFESERRYAATFYQDEEGTRVAVKGATEVVLPLCETMQTPEGAVPLDPDAVNAEALAMAQNGYRVLTIAQGTAGPVSELATPDETALSSLHLLGLVGFIDPLRPEVRTAVDRARQAGVEVVMITGDHPATAMAIASELGIARSETDVVTGREIEALAAEDSSRLLELVQSARVFARVTPLQKLSIVEILAALGHFVAVTGDGVNDAPALRRAHIGVAMGSGSDVAKDTALLIVADDNFASIVAGIEEGRFAYDNVRKVTYLLISTGAAEVLLITLSLLFGLPLPLLAVQLLWLNLVTNGIQDVALAFEAGEPGAMKRPPRRPAEGIFNRLMVQETVTSGTTMGLIAFGTWYWLLAEGWEEAVARNAVLLLMVLLQNFQVFNCRSELVSAFKVPLRRNPILVAGVLAAQGIHILAMQTPLMQEVLSVRAVPVGEWLRLLLLASLVLVVMELFKFVQNRRSQAFPASRLPGA